jgi:hypothetical protein
MMEAAGVSLTSTPGDMPFRGTMKIRLKSTHPYAAFRNAHTP